MIIPNSISWDQIDLITLPIMLSFVGGQGRGLGVARGTESIVGGHVHSHLVAQGHLADTNQLWF